MNIPDVPDYVNTALSDIEKILLPMSEADQVFVLEILKARILGFVVAKEVMAYALQSEN